MGRLSTFVFGGIIGAVLVLGSLKYHLVRAPDGLHLVPKLESNLSETYVDVRQFGPQQWSEHSSLVSALLKADKADLIGDTTTRQLGQGVNDALKGLMGSGQ